MRYAPCGQSQPGKDAWARETISNSRQRGRSFAISPIGSISTHGPGFGTARGCRSARPPTSNFEIAISDPGVIGAILRSPRLDTIIRQYVEKGIDFSGGTLVDFGSGLQKGKTSLKLKPRDIATIGLKLTPFLFQKKHETRDAYGFRGDITGELAR